MISRARSGGSGASWLRMSRRVRPSTYSITMYGRPSSWPWSNTDTTLGWESLAADRASRSNLRANSASSPSPMCITLTATVLVSRMSVAM